MTAHARCIAPENTLVEAAGLMRELDVGVLPVYEDEKLAGMVTDRDIVLRGVANGLDAYTATVREVMSTGVFHIFADQEVEEAARVMEERQVRRLPVLNRSKKLVGILSLGDVAVTSNPAFSGQALREVSESAQEHMRGGRTDSSVREQRARSQANGNGSAPKAAPADASDSGASADGSARVETRATAATDKRKRTKPAAKRNAPRAKSASASRGKGAGKRALAGKTKSSARAGAAGKSTKQAGKRAAG